LRLEAAAATTPCSKIPKVFWFFFSKKNHLCFLRYLLYHIALHNASTGCLKRFAMPFSRACLLSLALVLLSGCSTVSFPLFHPQGPVAQAQWLYTLVDVGVMLLIILPVILLAIVFMFRYRQSRNAHYDPTWSHSMGLELAMWGIPIVIVGFLGFVSYRSTLLVNPFNPTAINMSDAANPPLQVDVITTDWQWVFIYPQYGIATVDDLPVPAGRPVKLFLTSTSVTNDFFIPAVAPMIDVMPGMRTADGFQVDHPGNYEGFSADFSGEGFSWMQFSTRVMPPADFASWAARTAASPNRLSYAAFQKLAEPTVNVGAKPEYFSHVDADLFQHAYSDAQKGVVYAVTQDYKIATVPIDYTQGKNATK
jgi:cytochrome o ubiquinol oxidase subunit 2